VFERNLEADLSILAAQWDRVKDHVETTLAHQTRLLSGQMETIQGSLAELMGRSDDLEKARPQYMQIKSAIASAEAQADAAEQTVLAQYDEYADEVEGLSAHLDWVDWMLDALATASFQLLATEGGVAAAEAVWAPPGMEPENGVLFLTDQRLLWEDRVGDYELKVDVPLARVAGIKTGEERSGEGETCVVEFDHEVPFPQAVFHFPLPISEDWLKMVGRARAGEYVRDRAVEIDPDELERVRNAPEQCHNCGAAFTAPILRGQLEIICEYCGVVTRL
jgi:hypothetical protein